MRYDAPILVKRYAPIQGYPDGPRRIAILSQCYTLADAFERIASLRRHRAYWIGELEKGNDRTGHIAITVRWYERASFWIERRSSPATRRGRGGAC